MRGYAKITCVSILMMGLLAVPNLSPATDVNGRHQLLNTELRLKIEQLRNKMAENHTHRHNKGDIAATLEALQAEVTGLRTDLAAAVNNEASLLSQLNAANTQLSSLTARLSTLETSGGGGGSTNPVLAELTKYVKVDPGMLNGLKGPHVIFHHANIHVESGSGTTAEVNGLTGLGNLIVGYNEIPVSQNWSRAGSHNLIVGPSHSFTSKGGAVFGNRNIIAGEYATTLGGVQNSSTGAASSILGGYGVIVNGTEETYP